MVMFYVNNFIFIRNILYLIINWSLFLQLILYIEYILISFPVNNKLWYYLICVYLPYFKIIIKYKLEWNVIISLLVMVFLIMFEQNFFYVVKKTLLNLAGNIQ